MTAARFTAALALLALAVVAAASRVSVAALLATAGLAVHLFWSRCSLRRLRILAPILSFAILLALIQWLADQLSPELPLKTVAVFLLVSAATRLLPWAQLLTAAPPRSRLFPLALFLLFLRHFALILEHETRRLLVARSLAVRKRHGPGSFTSLCWAMASLFRRSLTRAERFYAAQTLRGLGE